MPETEQNERKVKSGHEKDGQKPKGRRVQPRKPRRKPKTEDADLKKDGSPTFSKKGKDKRKRVKKKKKINKDKKKPPVDLKNDANFPSLSSTLKKPSLSGQWMKKLPTIQESKPRPVARDCTLEFAMEKPVKPDFRVAQHPTSAKPLSQEVSPIRKRTPPGLTRKSHSSHSAEEEPLAGTEFVKAVNVEKVASPSPPGLTKPVTQPADQEPPVAPMIWQDPSWAPQPVQEPPVAPMIWQNSVPSSQPVQEPPVAPMIWQNSVPSSQPVQEPVAPMIWQNSVPSQTQPKMMYWRSSAWAPAPQDRVPIQTQNPDALYSEMFEPTKTVEYEGEKYVLCYSDQGVPQYLLQRDINPLKLRDVTLPRILDQSQQMPQFSTPQEHIKWTYDAIAQQQNFLNWQLSQLQSQMMQQQQNGQVQQPQNGQPMMQQNPQMQHPQNGQPMMQQNPQMQQPHCYAVQSSAQHPVQPSESQPAQGQQEMQSLYMVNLTETSEPAPQRKCNPELLSTPLNPLHTPFAPSGKEPVPRALTPELPGLLKLQAAQVQTHQTLIETGASVEQYTYELGGGDELKHDVEKKIERDVKPAKKWDHMRSKEKRFERKGGKSDRYGKKRRDRDQRYNKKFTGACHVCGEVGHKKFDCTKNPGRKYTNPLHREEQQRKQK